MPPILSFAKLYETDLEARHFDTHLYADYAELLCLAHPDHEITRSSYQQFLETRDFFDSTNGAAVDRGDSSRDQSAFAEPAASPHSIIEEDEIFSSINGDETDESEIVTSIERDMRRDVFFADIFEHLHNRRLLVKQEHYPFTCDDRGEKLTLKGELSDRQQLYLFLLLCSNLRFFTSHQNRWTGYFEEVSEKIFRCLLPAHAQIHIVGKGGAPSEQFKNGTKLEKLAAIAEKLNTKLGDVRVAPGDTGDAGLDLLGWIPTNDSANSLLVYFGQCACGKPWDRKQYEVSPTVWEGYFHLKHRNNSIVFIPYYFRDEFGDWPEPQKVTSFLVDRSRILSFADQFPESPACSDAIAGDVSDLLATSGFIFG